MSEILDNDRETDHFSKLSADESSQVKIAGRWEITRFIEMGGCGKVYQARDSRSGDIVAVKLATIDSTTNDVRHEKMMYEKLWRYPGMVCIPKVLHYEMFHGKPLLILTHHGPTIFTKFIMLGGRLSIKSAIMTGFQVLVTVEAIHQAGFVHCDIKPDNILMGNQRRSETEHVIDFSHSRRFLDPQGNHVLKERREHGSMAGTIRFSSRNSHFQNNLSRRDDIESIGYLIVYLISSTLPWQGVGNGYSEESIRTVGQCKSQTPPEQLCAGMPRNMLNFFRNVYQLKFDEKPDYYRLRQILNVTLEEVEDLEVDSDIGGSSSETEVSVSYKRRRVQSP